jgi:hypothetical protein
MVLSGQLESGEALSTRRQSDGAAGPRHGHLGSAVVGDIVTTNSSLRKAMRDISGKKGDFTLFAKIRRSDSLGNWDLVVSAPWLEAGNLKATSELVELLSDSIGNESLQELSRIATVGGDNPTVKFMQQNFAVEDGELRVQITDLFGLQIEEAVVFRAKRPTAIPPSSKRMEPTPR